MVNLVPSCTGRSMISPGCACWPRVKFTSPSAFCHASSTTTANLSGLLQPEDDGEGRKLELRRADGRVVLLLGHDHADLGAQLAQHLLGQVAPGEEDPHHVLEEDQARGALGKQLVLGRVEGVQVAVEAHRGDPPRHVQVGQRALAGLLRRGEAQQAGRVGLLAVGGGLQRAACSRRRAGPRPARSRRAAPGPSRPPTAPPPRCGRAPGPP